MGKTVGSSGCGGCLGCLTFLIVFGWFVERLNPALTKVIHGIIWAVPIFFVAMIVLECLVALLKENNSNKEKQGKLTSNQQNSSKSLGSILNDRQNKKPFQLNQNKSNEKRNCISVNTLRESDVETPVPDRLKYSPIVNQASNKIEVQHSIKPDVKENLQSAFNNAKSNCESPIEEQFWEIALAQDKLPGLIPQFQIGGYRIDFALPEQKIAIELDGHDYHKSKDQRTYDAKRERDLQKLGWTVIRFTGTEVYKNVYKCIEDVKDICKTNM